MLFNDNSFLGPKIGYFSAASLILEVIVVMKLRTLTVRIVMEDARWTVMTPLPRSAAAATTKWWTRQVDNSLS